VTTPATESTEGLVRAIGVRSLAANGINLTLGAGIFALPAVVAAQLGAAAIAAYLVCALAMCLVVLCFAEAGSRISRSGGAYAYVEAAFGPYAGFLVAVLLWFGFGVLSDAAIANVLVDSLAAVVPGLAAPLPRALFMIGLFAALAAINVMGVRQGVRFAVGVTLVKLLPLVILIVGGVFAIRPDNLAWPGLPSAESLGTASLVLFFAFGGMETALTASGEIRDPARTVPRGILLAVGGILFLYLGVQVVAQGVLGPALAESGATPLAAAADRALGEWGRVLLLAGAALSGFGNIAGDLLAMPRALFANARDGLLPAPLAAVHPRFRTPHVAIMAYAAMGITFSVTGAFRQLAVYASASVLAIYLAVCLATIVLQRRGVQLAGEPFRLPGGPIIPLLGATIVSWLLLQGTRQELFGLGVGFLVATAAYAFRRRRAVA
jgi:amino acid transporter